MVTYEAICPPVVTLNKAQRTDASHKNICAMLVLINTVKIFQASLFIFTVSGKKYQTRQMEYQLPKSWGRPSPRVLPPRGIRNHLDRLQAAN